MASFTARTSGGNAEFNGFGFGDGLTAPGNAGSADWDYLRVYQVSSVPEPSSFCILLVGIATVGICRFRRRRARAERTPSTNECTPARFRRTDEGDHFPRPQHVAHGVLAVRIGYQWTLFSLPIVAVVLVCLLRRNRPQPICCEQAQTANRDRVTACRAAWQPHASVTASQSIPAHNAKPASACPSSSPNRR